ncbi:type VI secretion system protein TssA [Rugamonas sp. CCM 8940]|uniref:type VI secretion system protein TssA n=1 Tax=Rugamonas sp. CCM 8940 TaxID=2765359 RepID=UPI0018F2E6E6|nr:type VI secretion system protein TssA [Rugamonas sp. CCM 8940]MBJ7310774.1 type VI secretion system protein TssA [Rugamonas sp. CCM 8940]
MFNIAQLLVPISVASPCGDDISFSSEVDDIAKARQHDDPSLDQGEWVVALKEADWPLVASRCAKLIAAKSKDLRLAVWLAEARAKSHHFRGLGEGYALLAGLCEQYWDGLHPAADDGDYEQRIGNLCWLLSRTPPLVREMPLTEGQPFSLADFELARQRSAGVPVDAGQPWSVAAVIDPTLAEMEAERRRNSSAFNDQLLADAEYCLAMLEQLERVLDQRLGADGPGFSMAREALRGALHAIAPLVARADAGDSATPAAAAGEGRAFSANRVDGALQNRAQALAQLRQVADFFRRTEPHSPVAYLADKAAHWGELPLHLWLREVIKDPAAMAGLAELLGAGAAAE